MLIGLSYIHCPLHLHQHHDTVAPPALWSKNTRDPTMNPGGCSISSAGTVRSRRAASPDTSSAMGTTGWAERWAMKWKWEAQLCSANLSPRSGRKVSVGSPAGRMWSQPPRVVHASPAGCRLLFYISPELAKSLTWIYVPPSPFPFHPPPCAWNLLRLTGEWKQLQGYRCPEGKNVFCGAVWRSSRSFAFRRGYSRTPPNLSQETWFLISQPSMGRCGQGWRLAELQIVDCWPVELQGWLFLSCSPICMWMVQL